MLQQFADLLISFIWDFWYPGLFFASFMENLFPPIPSEMIMPFGWILASKWQMTIIWAILATSIWSTLGSLPYYFLWKKLHRERVLKLTDRRGKFFMTNRKDMEIVFDEFTKNWKSIVFFGRFLPLWRWFISLPAWSANMNFTQFMIFSYAWTLIRSTFLVMVWYFVWENKQRIIEIWTQYKIIVIPLFIIFFIRLAIRFYIHKNKKWKIEIS